MRLLDTPRWSARSGRMRGDDLATLEDLGQGRLSVWVP
jgi:hypothetical protein